MPDRGRFCGEALFHLCRLCCEFLHVAFRGLSPKGPIDGKLTDRRGAQRLGFCLGAEPIALLASTRSLWIN